MCADFLYQLVYMTGEGLNDVTLYSFIRLCVKTHLNVVRADIITNLATIESVSSSIPMFDRVGAQ